MEQIVSKCGNCDVDLESGEAVLDGKLSDEQVTDGFNTCYGLGSYDGSLQCDGSLEDVKLIVDKKTVVGEKKAVGLGKKSGKEKPKAVSATKPPKPPRPPRGLSLDSADQKLIRELAEMAKLKRARIERMKALMKMKEARTSSTKNQIFATLFTVLFCLVILFQGISSRTNSAATFQASPTTYGANRGGMISIWHSQNLSINNANQPGSESPSMVEQVSLSHSQEKVGRSIG